MNAEDEKCPGGKMSFRCQATLKIEKERPFKEKVIDPEARLRWECRGKGRGQGLLEQNEKIWVWERAWWERGTGTGRRQHMTPNLPSRANQETKM